MNDTLQVKEIYLHLLKNTLAFTLWPDPLVPVTEETYAAHSWPKKWIVALLLKVVSLASMTLAKKPIGTEAECVEGRIWRQYPDTMIGLRRLDNIQFCVESVLKDKIYGDLIETGAWRGGAAIFMRGLLAAANAEDRRIFVADSFEGLPKPDAGKYPADLGDKHYMADFLAVDLDTVKHNFARYGLLDDRVIFLKGWFKDTLQTDQIRELAILRLDGDMYSSTMEALTALYPKLSAGGYCIIDDYHLDGCRKAVDDYRKSMSINQPLQTIDWAGRFWRK